MYVNEIARTRYYSKAKPPKIGDHAIPHHEMDRVPNHVIEIIDVADSGYNSKVYLIQYIKSSDLHHFPLHKSGWKDEQVLFKYYSKALLFNYNDLWNTLNG